MDENNVSVPLSTVYTHHWIAVNDVHKNELCKNGPEYVFGIGAESRNNPIHFPSGYGHVVTGERYWGANLHLLHTQGLAGDPHKAAKECNECYYAPGKGDECTCTVLGQNDQEEYLNISTQAHPNETEHFNAVVRTTTRERWVTVRWQTSSETTRRKVRTPFVTL